MASFGCVVFTADDANFCSSIDQAILELVDAGRVTNVAAFARSRSQFDFETCRERGATVGAHLNLTSGYPISDPSGLATLLNDEYQFVSPLSFIDEDDNTLFDAIQRHRETVANQYSLSELTTELKAQFQKLICDAKVLNGWHSFHQDLDQLPTVRSALNSEVELPSTRVENQQCGRLAGATYKLHELQMDPQGALNATLSMIEDAVLRSTRANGTPVEIALHPAVDVRGLSSFTAYKDQRILEFEVWMSDEVGEFIDLGIRQGNLVAFEIDKLGIYK